MPGRGRLVVFADHRIGSASYLVDAALTAAPAVGLSAVAVVDTAAAPPPTWLRRYGRRLASVGAERLFDPPDVRRNRRWRLPASLRRIARRHRVPLLVPPQRDVNHPRFVDGLRSGPGPTLGLSLGCLQRFGPALLDALTVAVNYHDGLLPAYRGLRATAWSLYRGEAASGFTFHHMELDFDTGPILLEGAVPVTPGVSVRELVLRKTRRAASAVEDVLGAMVAGDPGRPQTGTATYHGRREFAAVVRVEDPTSLDWADLQARLRAFGELQLCLGGRVWPVTALRRLQPGSGGALAFVTRDGVGAEPYRLLHLPPALYRHFRSLAMGG